MLRWEWCVVAALGCASCSGSSADACVADGMAAPATFGVKLRVLDEAGDSLDATVDTGSVRLATSGGVAALSDLRGPVIVLVSARGKLTEPVPVGFADANTTLPVVLLDTHGGARIAVHSAGDVMFARRYEAPTSGKPLIPTRDLAAGAAGVVSDVARAFAAADFRTINLESVIGNETQGQEYPKKSIVYASPPETLAGVAALGVDLAVLANNHACDYRDPGIAGTLRALDAAGIANVGARPDDLDGPPFITKVHRVQVGVLAYSAVSGSSTNDGYAKDGEPTPSNLPPNDAWEYEARRWGLMTPTWSVPEAQRRAGSAWTLFAKAEPLPRCWWA